MAAPADAKGVKEYLEGQVARYNRDDYQEIASLLTEILSAMTKALGIPALITARAKEILSFATKALRKRDRYGGQPVDMITDLCGGRVIVESKDKIKPIGDFIREYFEIDEVNSEDKAETIKAHEFGYQSVHFIVSFRRDKLPGEY